MELLAVAGCEWEANGGAGQGDALWFGRWGFVGLGLRVSPEGRIDFRRLMAAIGRRYEGLERGTLFGSDGGFVGLGIRVSPGGVGVDWRMMCCEREAF